MLNDPFFLSREQADGLTDREAWEWYFRRYEDRKADEHEQRVEAQLAENERIEAAKPLAQRKAEFWSMSAEFGCGEKEIQAAWDEYERNGSN